MLKTSTTNPPHKSSHSLRDGQIPFDISLNQPNQETVTAMLEAERIARDPSAKGYQNADELFAKLDNA